MYITVSYMTALTAPNLLINTYLTTRIVKEQQILLLLLTQKVGTPSYTDLTQIYDNDYFI